MNDNLLNKLFEEFSKIGGAVPFYHCKLCGDYISEPQKHLDQWHIEEEIAMKVLQEM